MKADESVSESSALVRIEIGLSDVLSRSFLSGAGYCCCSALIETPSPCELKILEKLQNIFGVIGGENAERVFFYTNLQDTV